MGIVGNLPESIKTLQKFLVEKTFKSPWQTDDFVSQFFMLNDNQFKEMNNVTHPLTIHCIFNELSKLLDDSVVFMDQSAIGCSSVRHYIAQRGGYFTSPTGYSIAQGVAGVIGGKIALPDKQVFCITGDGAFLMHGAEVLTAVQYNLGITWIIFKEDYYNMIQINQCLAYGGGLEFCTSIKNPDYQYLAKAYHTNFFEVNTLEDLRKSITTAKTTNSRNESTIIIINYDFEQHLPVKPQLIQTMKDLGQTKDIKSNPYLMKAFTKTLKEKV
jgi:thiamine pyrophosphate-dependent acetolactate synthase large subunit-like protein